MTKITVIIFTYNRALQLEALLESMFAYFVNIATPVHIIYHWSKEHEESYLILKERWGNKGVVFHQRSGFLPKRKVLKFLFRPINLYWYLRDSWLRNKFDDFKILLESIILESATQFVSFSTDDQIMFKETIIPEKAIELMKSNPRKYSYRFITGMGFKDEHALPEGLEIRVYTEDGQPSFFEWSNASRYAKGVWKYRFHVDGTVYEKYALLRMLKPMIYHMPTTLEGIGLWESRLRNYFTTGLSSVVRTFIGVQANNIQTVSDTPTANFKPDLLMKAYLKGYTLSVKETDIDQSKYIYVPIELYFRQSETGKVASYSELVKNI